MNRAARSGALLVIPARYGSSRLPGKPLADLAGAPLIVRVLERIRPLEHVRILVATDDHRIADVVGSAGGEVMMTSSHCRSGLDRVAEVAEKLEASCVVNLQGDEPFVELEAVARLIDTMEQAPTLEMATLACPLRSRQDFLDPNVVKVVVDARDVALYFSRAPIPWPRDGDPLPSMAMQHLGVYAYRRDTLLRLAGMPTAPLEAIEQLEQLRALDAGIAIRVVRATGRWLGIDTPDDLLEARRRFMGPSQA